MSIRRLIAKTPFLRPIALRVLRWMARDTHLCNPWTGDSVYLNTFRHKGYWFFGKDRERRTMERFAQLARPGSTIIEVGGHIGFITQYFSKLVGQAGQVIVFEPGSNNLPYLRKNIEGLSNVHLETIAVSDRLGEAVFHEDNLTGQNNSLLGDYKGADSVSLTHGMEVVRSRHVVQLTTLADYISRKGIVVDFIKIDIEGHELAALVGAEPILFSISSLMVEVTEQQSAVGELLDRHGFQLYNSDGVPLRRLDDSFNGNLFAIKPSK